MLQATTLPSLHKKGCFKSETVDSKIWGPDLKRQQQYRFFLVFLSPSRQDLDNTTRYVTTAAFNVVSNILFNGRLSTEGELLSTLLTEP
jgi:hypothetical protein